MKQRIPFFFLSFSLPFLLLMGSCVPLKTLTERKPPRDPFSRIYPVAFKDFHPKLNQALQKYAGEKPGNSFQVVRLGNDSVILRGYFNKEANQVRLPVVITTRPVGLQKTRLEIKPSAIQAGGSSESIEIAAGELFQIIEKETGFLPVE